MWTRVWLILMLVFHHLAQPLLPNSNQPMWDWQWNTRNSSQPTPIHELMGQPVSCSKSTKKSLHTCEAIAAPDPSDHFRPRGLVELQPLGGHVAAPGRRVHLPPVGGSAKRLLSHNHYTSKTWREIQNSLTNRYQKS